MRGLFFVSLLTVLLSGPVWATNDSVEPKSTQVAVSCEELLTDWKVIRDLLPAIFVREGDPTEVVQIPPELRGKMLIRKLAEELIEFSETPNIEEMADLEEVLIGLKKAYALDPELVEARRLEKLAQKGGFDEGYAMKLPKKSQD